MNLFSIRKEYVNNKIINLNNNIIYQNLISLKLKKNIFDGLLKFNKIK